MYDLAGTYLRDEGILRDLPCRRALLSLSLIYSPTEQASSSPQKQNVPSSAVDTCARLPRPSVCGITTREGLGAEERSGAQVACLGLKGEAGADLFADKTG